MTPQQLYADDLETTSCMVAKFYDESTLDNLFIFVFNSFITHIPRTYCTPYSLADVRNIAFQTESLVCIRKASRNIQTSNYRKIDPEKPYTRKPWNSRHIAPNIDAKTASAATQKTRRRSPFLQPLEKTFQVYHYRDEAPHRVRNYQCWQLIYRSAKYFTTLSSSLRIARSIRRIHLHSWRRIILRRWKNHPVDSFETH